MTTSKPDHFFTQAISESALRHERSLPKPPRIVRGADGKFCAQTPSKVPWGEALIYDIERSGELASRHYERLLRPLRKAIMGNEADGMLRRKLDVACRTVSWDVPQTLAVAEGLIHDYVDTHTDFKDVPVAPMLCRGYFQLQITDDRRHAIGMRLLRTGDLSPALAVVLLTYQKEAVLNAGAELGRNGLLDERRVKRSMAENSSVFERVTSEAMAPVNQLIGKLQRTGLLNKDDSLTLMKNGAKLVIAIDDFVEQQARRNVDRSL